MNSEVVEEISEVSQDSKNMGLLIWIGTIFFGFIPGLVMYLVKKDDAYIKSQSMEALNWSITAIFAYIIAGILTFIVIGVFLIPVIAVCHLIFCIMGAIATSKGSDFKVPFCIRLIK
jgi:uncharacterized Tic20 family protein